MTHKRWKAHFILIICLDFYVFFNEKYFIERRMKKSQKIIKII